MNKVLRVSAAAQLLIGIYVLYSWIKDQRRESSYRTTLARYKQELPLGTDRGQVVRYLSSHNLKYNEVAFGFEKPTSYQIQIDQLPPSLVCGSWKVGRQVGGNWSLAKWQLFVSVVVNPVASKPRQPVPEPHPEIQPQPVDQKENREKPWQLSEETSSGSVR